jgi:hypothetical protein
VPVFRGDPAVDAVKGDEVERGQVVAVQEFGKAVVVEISVLDSGRAG